MKKPIIFILTVLLGCGLMTSCKDEGSETPIWIMLDSASPTKNKATVYGGSKAVYDFDVRANKGTIATLVVESFDPDVTKHLDLTPGTKEFEYRLTYDVPKYEQEPVDVLIQFRATNTDGDRYVLNCKLVVRNTMPGEDGGNTGE